MLGVHKAIKDRPQKSLWAGLALLRTARPLLRRWYESKMKNILFRLFGALCLGSFCLASAQADDSVFEGPAITVKAVISDYLENAVYNDFTFGSVVWDASTYKIIKPVNFRDKEFTLYHNQPLSKGSEYRVAGTTVEFQIIEKMLHSAITDRSSEYFFINIEETIRAVKN